MSTRVRHCALTLWRTGENWMKRLLSRKGCQQILDRLADRLVEVLLKVVLSFLTKLGLYRCERIFTNAGAGNGTVSAFDVDRTGVLTAIAFDVRQLGIVDRAGQIARSLGRRRLIGTGIDHKQHVSGFHLLAVLEADLGDTAGDLGTDLGIVDRIDAPREFGKGLHRLCLQGGDGDSGSRGSGLLGRLGAGMPGGIAAANQKKDRRAHQLAAQFFGRPVGLLANEALGLNEIGLCNIATAAPVAFDPYAENRETGAFILIDRFTNATAGAGMITFGLRRATNIHRQSVLVDKASRICPSTRRRSPSRARAVKVPEIHAFRDRPSPTSPSRARRS